MMNYTNAALTVIAVLLAVIALQQYQNRPVTTGELQELQNRETLDAWDARRSQIPVVITP